MAIDVKLTLTDQATRLYNQFVGNVNKQAATIDNTMKSIGTAVGAAFSIGAVASFMKTAAAANAEVARMDQALANNGLTEYKSELMNTADALRKKTAVDDDEIVKLQSMLIGYTGNIDAVRKLTPAILDLAAGTGLSVEAAGKLVARSQEGQEGLKRLGIVVGETRTEEERLAKVTDEVTKRYGGMAEAFAKTDAGGLQQMSNSMEDLEESAGNVFLNILKPSLPGILAMFDGLAWVVDKTFGAIKVGTTVIMTGLVTPLAAVENMMNNLGITSSHVLQNMMASGMRQVTEASNELIHGVDETSKAVTGMGNASSGAAMQSMLLSEQIKTLKKEIDGLNIGSDARLQKLLALHALEQQQKQLLDEEALAVMRLTGQWNQFNQTMDTVGLKASKTAKEYKTATDKIKLATVDVGVEATTVFDRVNKEFEEKQQQTAMIQMAIYTALGQSMQNIFANQEGGAKGMLKNILNMTISTVEGLMAAAAAAGSAFGIITFGASLAKDIALLAAGFAALETARGIVNRFHDEGVVGPGGSREPLANDEYYAIVRKDERIIYPDRIINNNAAPNAVTNNSTASQVNNYFNATINISAPGTPKEIVIDALRLFAREIGVTTLGEIKVNQRSALAIS